MSISKKYIIFGILVFLLALLPENYVSAEELTPVIETVADSIILTAKEEEKIGAVYIKWNNPVAPYQVETDHMMVDCGEYGFLHEYILLPEKSSKVTVLLPEGNMNLYKVRLFTDEEVPEDVQIWQPPCDRADIMLISSHADDEILFMGGIIPTYAAEAGARVQVVYMTEFWSTTPVREHEKLDGLWVDGLRTYPVCGNFPDIYVESLEQAEAKYDLQAMTDYLTDEIRRFKPQVIVTHDFEGEYGHGFHKLTAKAVSQALDAAADDTVRTDSEMYRSHGAWDVPKAYFHLYKENALHLDLNEPLESMGGQTALEAAKAAYLQHVSQQWCWFYVSDSYKYSCADFGLYRTNAGYDTGNDMLENVVPYSVQEEQERILQEEQKKREEEERRLEEEKAKEEARRLEQEEKERAEALQSEQGEAAGKEGSQKLSGKETAAMRNICILLGAGAAIIVLTVWAIRRKKR